MGVPLYRNSIFIVSGYCAVSYVSLFLFPQISCFHFTVSIFYNNKIEKNYVAKYLVKTGKACTYGLFLNMAFSRAVLQKPPFLTPIPDPSIHGSLIPVLANQPGQTDRRPDGGDDNIKMIKL